MNKNADADTPMRMHVRRGLQRLISVDETTMQMSRSATRKVYTVCYTCPRGLNTTGHVDVDLILRLTWLVQANRSDGSCDAHTSSHLLDPAIHHRSITHRPLAGVGGCKITNINTALFNFFK